MFWLIDHEGKVLGITRHVRIAERWEADGNGVALTELTLVRSA